MSDTVRHWARRALAVAVLVLALPIAAHAVDSKATGYPAGPGPSGFTTNVGFLASWYGREQFVGIRITAVDPAVTSVTITNRAGAVLFSGPVSPGQFIALPTTRVTWTGVHAKGGNNFSAVWASQVFE